MHQNDLPLLPLEQIYSLKNGQISTGDLPKVIGGLLAQIPRSVARLVSPSEIQQGIVTKGGDSAKIIELKIVERNTSITLILTKNGKDKIDVVLNRRKSLGVQANTALNHRRKGEKGNSKRR